MALTATDIQQIIDINRQIYQDFRQTGTLSFPEALLGFGSMLTLVLTGVNLAKITKLQIPENFASISIDQIRKRKELRRILYEMGVLSGCDRVALGRLSNGIMFGNEHHVTMTITDEACFNAPSLRHKYQSVDASKLYDEFECYIDKGFVQIERSDEGLNPECVAHMYSDDIYFQVSRLVMDGEKIIAILEFHYLRTSSDVFSQTSTRRRLNTLFYQLRDKLRTRK